MSLYRKLLMAGLCGGVLLQTTTSCQDTLAPLVANLAASVILEVLLGGLAT